MIQKGPPCNNQWRHPDGQTNPSFQPSGTSGGVCLGSQQRRPFQSSYQKAKDNKHKGFKMCQQKKNKGKEKASQAHAFEVEGFVHEVIMDEVMLNEAAESSTQANLDPWSEYDNDMAREEPEWFEEIIKGANSLEEVWYVPDSSHHLLLFAF